MAITPLDKLAHDIEVAQDNYFKESGHPRDCSCEGCGLVRSWAKVFLSAGMELDKVFNGTKTEG